MKRTERFISAQEEFKDYGKLSHKNLDDLQSEDVAFSYGRR